MEYISELLKIEEKYSKELETMIYEMCVKIARLESELKELRK